MTEEETDYERLVQAHEDGPVVATLHLAKLVFFAGLVASALAWVVARLNGNEHPGFSWAMVVALLGCIVAARGAEFLSERAISTEAKSAGLDPKQAIYVFRTFDWDDHQTEGRRTG